MFEKKKRHKEQYRRASSKSLYTCVSMLASSTWHWTITVVGCGVWVAKRQEELAAASQGHPPKRAKHTHRGSRQPV
jgi:hypothetical protein